MQGHAQDTTPAQPAQPLTVDLQRLLFEPDDRGLQDPVWRLEPSAGRRVVMLPLLVSPVDRQTELSRSPVELRGGRFVGFYVPEADAQDPASPERIDFARFTDPSPETLGRLLFGEADDEDQRAGDDEPAEPWQGGPADDAGGSDPAPPSAKPPRLTREITLLPGGKVKWGLDRGLPLAELQAPGEQNLYPYKLDPQLMRDKEPGRPERVERQDGESSRDYAERRRVAQTAYREELDAFRGLRDAVRDLPDVFEQQAPAVVYALFEVREGEGLVLQGPSPMPWALSDRDHEALRQLAQGGGGQLGEAQRQAARDLARLIEQGHPLDARAIALAVLRGRVAGAVQDAGPGFDLIAGLMGSRDAIARRIALVAVVEAEPQTRTTARLIDTAGKQAQGREREVLQRAALRTLFTLEIDDPDRAASLIAAVNQALADAEGTPAEGVLNELLTAYGKAADRDLGGEALGRVAVALIDRVNVALIPADQRGPAIAQIIRHAPSNAVAAGWLDVKLLRNSDQAMVGQTLTLLNEAQVSAPTKPANDSATERRDTDSGAPAVQARPQPTPDSSQADPPDDPVQPGDTEPGDVKPRIVLSGPIPIGTANHGLIAAFASDDPSHRALAWSALDRFRVEAQRHDAGPAFTPDAGPQVLGKVVASALGLTQTPASLVGFLDRHAGTELQGVADAALLRLMVEPGVDPAVAKQAAHRLVESGRDLGQLLGDATPGDRFKLIAAFYTHLQSKIPTVVSLVHEPGGSMAGWFMQQLTDARSLPTARQWAAHAGGEQAGGEAQLIRLAGTEDARLAAGAAAALVINAGGDETRQQQFAQAVAVMSNRDEQAVREAWTKIKTELYAEALASAQGTYTMLIRLHTTQKRYDPITGEALDPPAPARIVLGVVQLKADGASVSLSTDAVPVAVADDRLAVRIQSLASLRSFAKPELAGLPLSQLDQPLDLVPQDGGAWAGRTTLPDGRELEVTLEPAE
ncbi:MAG: hypothetical protein ACE37H_10835 [Phycisphaeraceae bacterium]